MILGVTLNTLLAEFNRPGFTVDCRYRNRIVDLERATHELYRGRAVEILVKLNGEAVWRVSIRPLSGGVD